MYSSVLEIRIRKTVLRCGVLASVIETLEGIQDLGRLQVSVRGFSGRF